MTIVPASAAPLSFDLLRRPWIPCLRPDGVREEVGLRDALLRAYEFRELRDPSPLVTVALHRLLLALLHRVYGPESLDAWKTLWDAGRLAAEPLDAYLAKWPGRFDLFDAKQPFYQDASLADETKETSGIARLTTGTQPLDTLFDHSLCPDRQEGDWPTISAADAARRLVAIQNYAISGGAGYRQTILARGVTFLSHGANLFETLLLNAMPPDERGSEFLAKDGLPAWEIVPNRTGTSRLPRGYLDYLTAQSRRILFDAVTEAGVPVVRQFRFKNGRTAELPEGCYEPTAAYRMQPLEKAIQFEAGRAMWRDSHALLQLRRNPGTKDEHRGPAVLAFAGLLTRDGLLDGRSELSVVAAGLKNENAKVFFWRLETLPLPLRSLNDDSLRSQLSEALTDAEQTAKHLYSAVRAVAEGLLTAGTRSADAGGARELTRHLAPEPLYWSRLETPFRDFFRKLAAAEEGAPRTRCRAEWVTRTLRSAAERAFEESAGAIGTSARDLRAIAAGRDRLRSGLAKLCKPYRSFLNDDDLPTDDDEAGEAAGYGDQGTHA